ncbi:B3/4 domain-containing protein [Lacibacterium aquatile]|uniref:B3/4 domain-containing protein n=1 Tax=Lacibacterium aquatile TaxID=1168082 RepID=A0ABW5DXK0_9PROT
MPIFSHAPDIWADFPDLTACALTIDGVRATADVTRHLDHFSAEAARRLEGTSEGDLPEIQAWRRSFSKMGLKPTQYRCASEALLRRFKKEGSLPQIHPLIDLCNAISIAFAIPIAVFDRDQIDGDLLVRRATGAERYLTFGGEIEQPEPQEVIFADASRNAHARRWTNRQSATSAIRPETTRALIVAEAQHENGAGDVARLHATLVDTLGAVWPLAGRSALLTADAPRFPFD